MEALPSTRPQVRITDAERELIIAFEGLMREPHPDTWFVPLIDEVHGKAVAEQLRELVLDIRRLSYANAAAWKCLVYWVKKMQQDRRAYYRLRVLCEEAHSWQHVGMPALRVFGGDRLVIDVYANGRLSAGAAS
jgi:hypothetical protein